MMLMMMVIYENKWLQVTWQRDSAASLQLEWASDSRERSNLGFEIWDGIVILLICLTILNPRNFMATCTLQIGGLWRRDPQNKSQLEEEHLSPANNHPINPKHCQAVQTSFTCQQPTNKPTTFWSSSKLSWDVSSFSPFSPELTCHCPADPCNTETTQLLDLSKMFRCNTDTQ